MIELTDFRYFTMFQCYLVFAKFENVYYNFVVVAIVNAVKRKEYENKPSANKSYFFSFSKAFETKK
jgi:hypothetical protein